MNQTERLKKLKHTMERQKKNRGHRNKNIIDKETKEKAIDE